MKTRRRLVSRVLSRDANTHTRSRAYRPRDHVCPATGSNIFPAPAPLAVLAATLRGLPLRRGCRDGCPTPRGYFQSRRMFAPSPALATLYDYLWRTFRLALLLID